MSQGQEGQLAPAGLIGIQPKREQATLPDPETFNVVLLIRDCVVPLITPV